MEFSPARRPDETARRQLPRSRGDLGAEPADHPGLTALACSGQLFFWALRNHAIGGV